MILNSNINDDILKSIDISGYDNQTYISEIDQQHVLLKTRMSVLPITVCIDQQICDVFRNVVDNIKIITEDDCDFISHKPYSYFKGINSISTKNFSFVLCTEYRKQKVYDLYVNSETFQIPSLADHPIKLELINCVINCDTLIINYDRVKLELNNSILAPKYIVFDYNPHIYLEKGSTNDISQILEQLNLDYVNPQNLKSIFIPIETKSSGVKIYMITNWYSQFISYMNKNFRQQEGTPNTYIIDTLLYYNWWNKEIHFKYDPKYQY